jgi:hypothetical protein
MPLMSREHRSKERAIVVSSGERGRHPNQLPTNIPMDVPNITREATPYPDMPCQIMGNPGAWVEQRCRLCAHGAAG